MPVPSWAVRKRRPRPTPGLGSPVGLFGLSRLSPGKTFAQVRDCPCRFRLSPKTVLGISVKCPLDPVLALRPRPKEAVAFRRSVPGLRSVQRSSGWYGGCSPNANRHTNRRRAHSRENFRSLSCSAFRFPFRRTPNPSSLPLFSPSPLPPDAQGAYAMNLKGVSASAR